MVGNRGAQTHRIAGEEIERVAKGLRAPEMMLEAMAPALGNVEIVEQRAKEAEIAERDLDIAQSRRGQGVERDLEDLRLGGFRIAVAHPFEPGLREFARRRRIGGESGRRVRNSNSGFRHRVAMHESNDSDRPAP